MPKEITITSKRTSETVAIAFAENTGGIREGKSVTFQATYSISRARYSVKQDKYVVYIHLYPTAPGSCKRMTVTVYADTSQEAYALARKWVEQGVYNAGK